MMQAFEWYVAADGKHFRRLARDIPSFDQVGISALWIPPACKGGGAKDNGYGIYGVYLLNYVDGRFVGFR
jgi:alpha-amylase